MSALSTKDLAKKLDCVRKVSHADSSSAKRTNYNTEIPQPVSYLFVLDFEATCWDKNSYSFGKNEIIEFPAVVLDVKSGVFVNEFQKFVQPTENPLLSDFCKNLTGINQGQVDTSCSLVDCLKEFESWMIACAENLEAQFYDHSNYKHRTYQHEGKVAAFVTWSDWDLGQCLQQECNRKCIRKPRQFDSWIDLRLLYRNFYKRSPTCLRDALENVGLKFEGQEHSGICDSRNTAALARKMIIDGCTMRITRTIERNGRKVHVIPPANSMLAALDRVKKDQAKGNGERLPKKPRLGVDS